MVHASQIGVIGRFVTTCCHRQFVRDEESEVSERGFSLREETRGGMPSVDRHDGPGCIVEFGHYGS